MDLNKKNVLLEVLLNNKTCVPFISIRNPKIQLIIKPIHITTLYSNIYHVFLEFFYIRFTQNHWIFRVPFLFLLRLIQFA
jgi:hypothetical protein